METRYINTLEANHTVRWAEALEMEIEFLCPQAFGDHSLPGRGSMFSNPRGKVPGLPAPSNTDRAANQELDSVPVWGPEV